MNDLVLNINGLTKRYRKFSFGPVDFRVEPGTVTALVGPNGSGKSTFFKIIMNMIQPDNGTIMWFGKNIEDKEVEVKQEIGYASGDLFHIFGHLTIKELANLVSYWYPNWDHQWFEQLMDRYEIDPSERYANCSTGMQKKVDFIFAIVHHPKLLLLDEPSASVDMMSQRKMNEDLMKFMGNGENSIIIATHLQEEVKQMSDYIYVLDKGKVISSFEKDEVRHLWARLWVTSLPDSVKAHQHVLAINDSPLQFVTDNFPIIEEILHKEEVTVTNTQPLDLNEVIAYMIEAKRTNTL